MSGEDGAIGEEDDDPSQSRSVVAASQTSSHPDTIPEVQINMHLHVLLSVNSSLK